MNFCIGQINRDMRKLGLNKIKIKVHKKRKHVDEGYNKVVVITNELGDLVVGRTGDGIVSYPYLWDDELLGLRSVNVDNKWNCLGKTPEDCCKDITDSEFCVDDPWA